MQVAILCGGAGTRLWPISRKRTPKQFSKIFEDKSLFQLTILRNLKVATGFIIVVNEEQINLCKEQFEELNLNIDVFYILESVGRNTAPAIALAALSLNTNENLLVLPSDHLISDHDIYLDAINSAKKLSEKSNLVTFGIKPRYAETGYGYIEAKGEDVLSFKEKPNLSLAKEYLASKRFFWNSGMFLFTRDTYLLALEEYSKEIFDKTKIAFEKRKINNKFISIDKNLMLEIPENSIDFAVMEKATNKKVVPSFFRWNDLGSFDSLYDELEKDDTGSTFYKNTVSIHSKNNLILGDNKLIALLDVEDLIVIDTKEALLVAKRGKSQNVKEIVQKLKEINPDILE